MLIVEHKKRFYISIATHRSATEPSVVLYPFLHFHTPTHHDILVSKAILSYIPIGIVSFPYNI